MDETYQDEDSLWKSEKPFFRRLGQGEMQEKEGVLGACVEGGKKKKDSG